MPPQALFLLLYACFVMTLTTMYFQTGLASCRAVTELAVHAAHARSSEEESRSLMRRNTI